MMRQKASRDRQSTALSRAWAGVERGAAAVYALILIPVLLVGAAIAVDLTAWYVELQRMTRTVDAASLAAAPFMPTDILTDKSDPASQAAVDLIVSNGYDPAQATISRVIVDGKPSPGAVRVTLTSTVTNSFARLAGLPTTTLTRTAVANFTGPAPLGSPCAIFGRQDMETTGKADESNCGEAGKYWVNLAGYNTNKARGDGYASGFCGRPDASDGGIDRCESTPVTSGGWSTANPNLDYPEDGEDGYVFIVKPSQSGPIRIQAYDLGWVAVGDNCTDGILSNPAPTDRTNEFVDATEAPNRYARGNNPENPFCTGDTEMGSHNGDSGASGPVETVVTVREPSENPFDPLLSGTPVICEHTFPGWRPNTPKDALQEGSGSYDPALARTFHRWMDPCAQGDGSGDESITSATGDYLVIPDAVAGQEYSIQIRTTQQGGGQNRFALRAYSAAGPVQIFADRNVSLFNNVPAGTSVFNVVRLDSSTAGKNLTIRFFDLADAAAPVQTTVLQPDSAQLVDDDGNVTPLNKDLPFPNCTGFGPVGGSAGSTLTNCTVESRVTTTGGKWQTIRVPIDPDYVCAEDDDRSKCWVRVRLFTTSSQSDTTTWEAGLDGDPVRLEE